MNIFLISNKSSYKPADFHVGEISVHESDLCVIRDGGVYSIYLIEEEPGKDSSWDDNAHLELEDSLSDYQDGFALFFENTQKRHGNKKILRELIYSSSETELTRFLENALDILQYEEDRWNVSYIKGIYKLFERSKEPVKEVDVSKSDEEDSESCESRLLHAESIESDNPEGAFLIYKELADIGHAEAQYRLGKCYRLSIGVEKNPLQEMYWFKAAAKQGHIDAQFRLAKLYEKSFTPDYKKAFRWYKKAAEQGDKKAISELITCYTYGRGTDKDLAQVNFWQTKLGGLEQNENVPESPKKEVEKPVVKEIKTDNPKLDKTSKTQYENALDLLAEGTPESQKKATVILFRAAATQGDAKVLYKLGECLMTGIGTKKDTQKAFYWIKKAADKGLVEAQCKLAELYLGKKSLQLAHRYFYKAAEGGSVEATFQLGYFLEKGIHVETNLLKAKELYIKAAEKDHAQACYRLGLLYKGKRPETSKEYLQKAEKLGSVEASKELLDYPVDLNNKREEVESKQKEPSTSYVTPNNYPFYEILKEEVDVRSFLMTDSIIELFADLYAKNPKGFRKARMVFKSKYPDKTIYYTANLSSSSIERSETKGGSNQSKKEVRRNQLIEFLKSKGYKYIDNTDKHGAFWILESERTNFSVIEKKGISVIFRPQGGKATLGKPAWIASF